MGKLLEKLRDFRRPKQIDLEEYIHKVKSKGLDQAGRLVPDPTPMAPPLGYKKQPSMVEIVRDMVRSEHLAHAARQAGMETLEEAEDFDIGDDGEDLRSGFENDFDPPLPELLKAGEESLAAKAAKAAPPASGSPAGEPDDGPASPVPAGPQGPPTSS